jgi:orotidine-5'-phosphate decarboxylase
LRGKDRLKLNQNSSNILIKRNKMKKIILALDVFGLKESKNLIEQAKDFVDIFKVGPILFLKCGREIIDFINSINKKVFLDLKFHDIPGTVRRSVESARDLGVYSLTVHSCGGAEMLTAAVSVKDRPKIWAVTVLTSAVSSKEEVLERALLAKSCGADGVIASPLESAAIKNKCGADFEAITPGIRLKETKDDQKRTATPQEALKNGADFLVIGRPVLESPNPAQTLKEISDSLEQK